MFKTKQIYILTIADAVLYFFFGVIVSDYKNRTCLNNLGNANDSKRSDFIVCNVTFKS